MLVNELGLPTAPKAADMASPDGVNGARHAHNAILTAYHRAALRVFRQLATGPQADVALAGFQAAATAEGRQLRPRRT